MSDLQSLSSLQTAIWLLLAAALGFVAVVSANSYLLLWMLVRHHKREYKRVETEGWPTVSVIVPVYNEKTLAIRALEACCCLDYPRDRFQILVADDSDDETVQLLEDFRGSVPVKIVRRQSREGYKAGALQNALSYTSAEFVSVTDADHVPSRDFLKQTVSILRGDDTLAFAQGRWAPESDGQSFLAKSVGLALDTHFRFDYDARAKSNTFPYLVGAGCVIRRTALEKVGGWRSDTLTEDLDLACRLRLAGLGGVFAVDATSVTEYPQTLDVFRMQQYRWAKGQMECLRKYGRRVLTSRTMSSAARFECLLFLCYYLLPGILLLAVYFGAVILAFAATPDQLRNVLANPVWLGYFGVTTAALAGGALMYLLGALRKGVGRVLEACFITVAMAGMSTAIARASIEGLIGVRSPFAGTERDSRRGGGRRVSRGLTRLVRRPVEAVAFFLGALASWRLLGTAPPLLGFSLFLAAFAAVWLLTALTP